MQHSVNGSVTVDGRPAGKVDVALLDATGRVIAATISDEAGRFGFAEAGTGVVAKLHAPVVGAAFAPVEASGPAVLAVSTRDAVTLSATIELPGGAAPAAWFDVELTPRALAGMSDDAVHALTLDGTGPARYGTYQTVRITEPRATLRVMPGSWDLKVSHIVEHGKMARPPASWIGGSLTRADGSRSDADLGSIRLELDRDTQVRVVMQPFVE